MIASTCWSCAQGTPGKLRQVSALNPNLSGRVFPATTYLVGREKIREFARGIRATHPLHHDVAAAQAAGYADVVAPTTFTTVLQQTAVTQLVETPDTGVDPIRVVHGSEKIEQRRPIVGGVDLVTTLTIADVIERGGNAILATHCEIRDSSDELVGTVKSTLLVRGCAA